MKKTALVLILIMFGVVSCSMPRLVKVEETPDPTATPVPVATEEVVVPTSLPTLAPEPTVPAVVEPPDLPILFSDNFSQDDGTWNVGVWPDDAGEDSITDGEYHMTVNNSTYLIWSRTFDFDTPNVLITVDSRLAAGPEENGQGFVCRYTDANNFYYLFIGNDGWFSIDKYVDDQYENIVSDWAPDGVIDPVSNHLQAECNGSTLSLTVNDTLLASAQDDSLTEGYVGLFTRSYETGNISIAYDNFVIYSADGSGNSGLIETPIVQDDGLIFSEDFEDSDGNWALGDYTDSNVVIEDGWMTYRMKTPSWVSWDVTGEVYANDVRMEAYFSNDAELTENQQGFICRYQDDDNYYLITFGNDGYLRLGIRSYGEWNFLVDEYGPEGTVDPTFNYVEATCIGNEMVLYINGVEAARATDPDSTIPSGDVGLMFGTFDDPNVIISVDDFMVYSLD